MAVHLRVVNQPGTLARLARAFSERGINLGDILATVGDDRLCLSDNEVPMIILTFQCSERILGFLKRRTERMPEVSKVTVIERSEIDERPIWELRPELLNA
jgi:acetolactate synthase small subunit